jgi:hypothetical protein
MPRRFAALLLSVAMLFIGLAASPCASSASCMMMAARPMDCCASKAGISKPSCCDKQQVSRNAAPVTPDRPVQTSLTGPVQHIASVVVTLADSTRTLLGGRIDPGVAPPGGTLIAQHTSLLL